MMYLINTRNAIITDGNSFFHEEKNDLKSSVEKIESHALGYRITNKDPEGRYTITKEVISDPHLSCLLQYTKLSGNPEDLSKLKLYVLCAPHLEVGGWGNNAQIVEVGGKKILTAQKGDT